MSILLGAALVAAMASGQDYAQQRVAPRGGYAQSCSEAYVNRGRLYADCRDTRGQLRGTSIELARCGGEEINNDNGLLVCGRWLGIRPRAQRQQLFFGLGQQGSEFCVVLACVEHGPNMLAQPV